MQIPKGNEMQVSETRDLYTIQNARKFQKSFFFYF